MKYVQMQLEKYLSGITGINYSVFSEASLRRSIVGLYIHNFGGLVDLDDYVAARGNVNIPVLGDRE